MAARTRGRAAIRERLALAIERAAPGDVPALLALDIWLTAPDRQGAIVRDSVASGGCYLARERGALAGFVTWDLGFFARPFVRLLAVAAAARRRGIARALLQRVEIAAAPHGELFVSTELINAPMQALLRALDYNPSGSVDNINARGNPELIFHKRLPAGPASSLLPAAAERE